MGWAARPRLAEDEARRPHRSKSDRLLRSSLRLVLPPTPSQRNPCWRLQACRSNHDGARSVLARPTTHAQAHRPPPNDSRWLCVHIERAGGHGAACGARFGLDRRGRLLWVPTTQEKRVWGVFPPRTPDVVTYCLRCLGGGPQGCACHSLRCFTPLPFNIHHHIHTHAHPSLPLSLHANPCSPRPAQESGGLWLLCSRLPTRRWTLTGLRQLLRPPHRLARQRPPNSAGHARPAKHPRSSATALPPSVAGKCACSWARGCMYGGSPFPPSNRRMPCWWLMRVLVCLADC